jgi:acetyl esterase/lipase
VDSLKKRMPDHAIFNVDYRLVSDDVHFTDQEVDIKAAIDFIAAHAQEYEINKGKIVLLGVSAGGHLALLQAYKNASPKIAAVIDFFGPTDLITMYNKPWSYIIPGLLQTLIGGTPQTNPDGYRDASPVSFINASMPPTLIFQGRQDPIVNVSQSQLLQQLLNLSAVKNKLVIYDREGHGWDSSVLSDSFDKIELFLKQYAED